MKVVDLFSGMGGIAVGFAREGFSVKGFDIDSRTEKIFEINDIGRAETRDLSRTAVNEKADVITGGPPCRPWSTINLTRRAENHPDYPLLNRFFEHVMRIRPAAFLLENVLPLKSDENFQNWVNTVEKSGYSVDYRSIRYSDFGASTSRRRLFTVGFKNRQAKNFFSLLEDHRDIPGTVGEAIGNLIKEEKGNFPDHEWPEHRTINRYKKYYRTGKYGWYRLEENQPAPSFGNVTKTYILPPFAGLDGVPLRVISVREAMAIMGFDNDYRFPEGMGMRIRYQMIADAVSPVFSRLCARTIKEIQDDEV